MCAVKLNYSTYLIHNSISNLERFEFRNELTFILLTFRGKAESTDIMFADFDGVLLHVSNHGGDKSKVKVSSPLTCYDILYFFDLGISIICFSCDLFA
jgi:hypothetical protein